MALAALAVEAAAAEEEVVVAAAAVLAFPRPAVTES